MRRPTTPFLLSPMGTRIIVQINFKISGPLGMDVETLKTLILHEAKDKRKRKPQDLSKV